MRLRVVTFARQIVDFVAALRLLQKSPDSDGLADLFVRTFEGLGVSIEDAVAAMLIHFTTDAPLWEFYCDNDWAGCPTTRRSRKGYVIKFMGGPLVAVSRRQRNVTKSSCEAEYCTLSDCAADIIWIKNLAEIFKCTFPSPAILRCDNQTAINMANSEVALKRTKHIEAFKKFIGVKYHWIRELVRYSCKKQAAVVLYCILGPS
jgi:hypothetical protein